jgi:hypothetical protein
MKVDIGRAEWPGQARPVGRRVRQLEPGRHAAAGGGRSVGVEARDPRRALIRVEVDPDAVDLDPAAAVARQ